MSNDNYEYPEGSSPDKKYGMMSKDGRTESLPAWVRDPKVLAMAVLSGSFIYLVTHLLSYAIGERTDKTENKADIITQSDAKISAISSKIEQDKDNTRKKLSSFSDTVKTLSDDAKEKAQRVDSNSAKISSMESKLNNYEQQLGDINYNISQLSQSIVELKQSLAKPKVVKKKIVKKIPVKLKTYFLRAMVHGRAWVESEHGDYLTVKIGDMLPTYGRIVYMDDNQGVVKTTSGRDIRYATN